MKRTHPFVIIDFKDELTSKRLIFKNPIQVIEAHSIEGVLPALLRVEHTSRKKGLYAVGFVSYEAAPAFDALFKVRAGTELPLVWFGVFAKPDVIQHDEHKGRHDYFVGGWQPTTDKLKFDRDFQAIHTAIARGETYQVNYTMRLQSSFDGEDLDFYEDILAAGQGNYSAYLHTGRFRILSSSPELFFRRSGNRITMRPMKGTAPRGRFWQEDEERISHLMNSDKDRTENVMIVDLLRNDLSQIAETGSVHVDELFTVEKYPTVLQMTSTVSATLHPEVGLAHIFSGLFPCGSITGVPKIKTMEIISHLESSPRNIYCGSIGLIMPTGDAVFNVSIRTVTIDADRKMAEYGVGAGITWASSSQGEYDEMMAKSAVLTNRQPSFDLLESMKIEDGQYTLLDRHLARLKQSALYFDIAVDWEKLDAVLQNHLNQLPQNSVFRARLRITQNGMIHLSSESLLNQSVETRAIEIADTPISRENPFLYHKTTSRDIYESHRQAHPAAFDVLLWNESGQLTEFTIGNLVLEVEGQMWTPPQDCGLLAGTYREELLAQGRIGERVLYKSDLIQADRIWLINSIRGFVPVRLTQA